jgi:hypothetical protein
MDARPIWRCGRWTGCSGARPKGWGDFEAGSRESLLPLRRKRSPTPTIPCPPYLTPNAAPTPTPAKGRGLARVGWVWPGKAALGWGRSQTCRCFGRVWRACGCGEAQPLRLRAGPGDRVRRKNGTLLPLSPDGAGSGRSPIGSPSMLRKRDLSRDEVVQTRQGVCRLGPGLAQKLGQHSRALREAVGPHAERLARELLKAPGHPTPLTRRNQPADIEADNSDWP